MAEKAADTPDEMNHEDIAPEAPKRRRGRPRKTAVEEAPSDAGTPEKEEKPKRATRAKATKAKAKAKEQEGEVAAAPAAAESSEEAPAEAPKRRRGRPRKADAEKNAEKNAEQKSEQPGEHSVDAMNKMTQEATVASSDVAAPVATTLAEADAQSEGASAAGEGQSRRRKRNGQNNKQQGSGSSKGQQNQGRAQQNQGQNQGGKRNQNKRRNRRNQELAAEPSLTREELEGMLVNELRAKASELGVEYAGIRKKELIEVVYQAAALAEGFRPVSGVIEMQNDGYAFLRTGNYMPGEHDAFVHQQVIRTYGLRAGDKIEGQVAPSKTGNKYPPLQRVDTINGRTPEEVKNRPRFRDLTPIYPDVRLTMEHGKDSITGRAIDLVAPIGKGQRGLIVSPPKAGKTTVLKRICESIATNNPEVHLLCLLVDERPEEVTDMERSIRGEVVASTFDMPADNHTAVSELVIEHAKRLVEQGEDVVVVLDSITRLARAYNLAQPASGRILSGGVDSAALYPPKKFLGAARNIENGGSLTILASALVDTGSKMDEVIFEEFKGTGNMELKLDRDLADKRIFPAIDPVASGTRNEELLIDAELQPFVWGIRRVLSNMNNTERAASALVKGLKATNDNQEFLIRSAKKAQQSGDYLG